MKAGPAKHKFSDPDYDQQKARIAEELDDALREGILYITRTFFL